MRSPIYVMFLLAAISTGCASRSIRLREIPLVSSLQDEDPQVRSMAAQVLGEEKEGAATVNLIGVLLDDELDGEGSSSGVQTLQTPLTLPYDD